jgi:hypothetical protein
MSLRAGTAVDVVAAERVGQYRLKLTFSDGHASEVDVGPFLRGSLNPETRRFLDDRLFGKFSLADGNLVWGDYALCFPIEDLYSGQIDHRVPANGHAAQGTPYPQPSARKLAVAEPRARYGARRTARR